MVLMVSVTGNGHLGVAQHSRADHKAASNFLHDGASGCGSGDNFNGDMTAWIEGLALSRNQCNALGGQGVEQASAHHGQPTEPCVKGSVQRLSLAALFGINRAKQQPPQQGRRRLAPGGVGQGGLPSTDGLIKPIEDGEHGPHHGETGLSHGGLTMLAGSNKFSLATRLSGLKGRQSRRHALGLRLGERVGLELLATGAANLFLKGDDSGLERINLRCQLRWNLLAGGQS
jgi:hypothetical protein